MCGFILHTLGMNHEINHDDCFWLSIFKKLNKTKNGQNKGCFLYFRYVCVAFASKQADIPHMK
jgi:hypothetical protein